MMAKKERVASTEIRFHRFQAQQKSLFSYFQVPVQAGSFAHPFEGVISGQLFATHILLFALPPRGAVVVAHAREEEEEGEV